MQISIRAPARGATLVPSSMSSRSSNFNPRSREGSDDKVSIDVSNSLIFQSALPRGERPVADRMRAVDEKFQSALPRGERRFCSGLLVLVFLSFQSALPRGERLWYAKIIKTSTDFNPRSREGSDEQVAGGFCPFRYFNPRSREGSDMKLQEKKL